MPFPYFSNNRLLTKLCHSQFFRFPIQFSPLIIVPKSCFFIQYSNLFFFSQFNMRNVLFFVREVLWHNLFLFILWFIHLSKLLGFLQPLPNTNASKFFSPNQYISSNFLFFFHSNWSILFYTIIPSHLSFKNTDHNSYFTKKTNQKSEKSLRWIKVFINEKQYSDISNHYRCFIQFTPIYF